MTATTKPPIRESRPRQRQIRFSSMETLGFSNPTATWSDRPVPTPVPIPMTPVERRGRHEAPEPEPETVADWKPEDIGARLTGRNTRWSIVVVSFLVVCGIGGLAYWLYQRPVAQAEASLASLSIEAERLRDALPALETFNASLTGNEPADSTELFGVDAAARALFDASGNLPGSSPELRSSAAAASTSALDGIRLAGDANSYRLAVTPILMAPELETDPNLVELDEAARGFGDWQLRFDEVRTALPDRTLTTTTEQLDILSGDLPGILTNYMDALREDDQVLADAVLAELAVRLGAIHEEMKASLEEIQTRVAERVAETVGSLGIALAD